MNQIRYRYVMAAMLIVLLPSGETVAQPQHLQIAMFQVVDSMSGNQQITENQPLVIGKRYSFRFWINNNSGAVLNNVVSKVGLGGSLGLWKSNPPQMVKVGSNEGIVAHNTSKDPAKVQFVLAAMDPGIYQGFVTFTATQARTKGQITLTTAVGGANGPNRKGIWSTKSDDSAIYDGEISAKLTNRFNVRTPYDRQSLANVQHDLSAQFENRGPALVPAGVKVSVVMGSQGVISGHHAKFLVKSVPSGCNVTSGASVPSDQVAITCHTSRRLSAGQSERFDAKVSLFWEPTWEWNMAAKMPTQLTFGAHHFGSSGLTDQNNGNNIFSGSVSICSRQWTDVSETSGPGSTIKIMCGANAGRKR